MLISDVNVYGESFPLSVIGSTAVGTAIGYAACDTCGGVAIGSCAGIAAAIANIVLLK